MRHQFFGGPLNGKVLLLDVLLNDQELREDVPWEQYAKMSEEKTPDGVLDLIKWAHRETEPESVPTPPNAPGGYPVVQQLVERGIDEPRPSRNAAEIAARLAQMQKSTEAAHRQRMIDNGLIEAPRGDVGASAVMDETVESTPVPATQDAPGPDYGDYGTLPGEFDFKAGRGRHFQMWQWGPLLVEGGSSSLGKAIESGEVTQRQVNALKKLGLAVESPDDVYKAAENLIHRINAGEVVV